MKGEPIFYSTESCEAMRSDVAMWSDRARRLGNEVISLHLEKVAAREMAHHAVGRRLNDLRHFIRRLYDVLPPEVEKPSREARLDATAFLQAFVVNIFGVIDNLAWMWVIETDVRKAGGEKIPASWVGLRSNQTAVRETLSKSTQAYLSELDSWFIYLEEFRHHLAHRIPLYIPPFVIDEANAAEVQSFQEHIFASGWTLERWFAVIDFMERKGAFAPYMAHSIEGGRVPFHAQMICDLGAVVELGERIVSELKDRTDSSK